VKVVLSSRKTKIIVDILMTIFMILSFVRWEDSNFAFHAIVGTACTLFFTLHICIHWKWLKAVTKSFIGGKLGKALAGKYVVDVLLIIAWGVSIITGFIAVGYFVFNVESMAVFGGIHGTSANIGLVLVIIHVFQHIPQIKSYMGIKNKHQKSIA